MELDQFKTLFPHAQEAIYHALETFILQYQIQNVRMFLAQTSEESGRFTQFTENLNYSAPRLQVVWPSHFTTESAPLYAYQPEKLANYIYAKRLGNGNEASGDGWKFRGRGLIQLTGRTLYTMFANSLKMNVDQVTTYMDTPLGAVESACWYWIQIAKVNQYALRIDVPKVTIIINGGSINLQERYNEFDRINE